jgi:hypothetical protein
VTRKATQRSRGMTRPAAARRTRSMARSLRGARRPLQHPELRAENEDLEVLGSVGSTRVSSADEETDEGADDEVEPRGGNDTPKAREIGYSAASPRSCVWWRYCGRHRGRSDRRDRRWSARGDRRRHHRCCPWRYCRQEDCRGCAAWRPAPGEAVHQRRRIAGTPKPARLTPTRDPGTGHLPSAGRPEYPQADHPAGDQLEHRRHDAPRVRAS